MSDLHETAERAKERDTMSVDAMADRIAELERLTGAMHTTAEMQAAVIRETIAVMRKVAARLYGEVGAPWVSADGDELSAQADKLAEACGFSEKKDGEG